MISGIGAFFRKIGSFVSYILRFIGRSPSLARNQLNKALDGKPLPEESNPGGPAEANAPPQGEDGAPNPEDSNVPFSAPLKKKMTRDELEFLPAALEIVETPANPMGRVVALVIAVFFAFTLAWAFVGKVDVVAVSQGQIIAAGGIQLIQPREIGTIQAIHVREGQHVEAGELLIELDPTESEVDEGQVMREKDVSELGIIRLRLFLEGLRGPVDRQAINQRFKDLRTSMGKIVDTTKKKLESDLAAFYSQVSYWKSEIQKRKAALSSANTEIDKLNELIPLLRERENALRKLYEKGITPKPNWLAVKQQLIETRSDLKIYKNRLVENKESVNSAQKELERLVAQTEQKAFQDLLDITNRYEAAVISLRQVKNRSEMRRLTSPVSGTVQQLKVHTVRGVVSPAEPLMAIVPDDAALEIEANVLNRDVGFVFAGQDAAIKIDSFPFTRYGKILGKVKSVSRDAINKEDKGLVYSARVSMSRFNMDAGGRKVKLSPGMTVVVEIKTGKRRIIDYILSPILEYEDEALRER